MEVLNNITRKAFLNLLPHFLFLLSNIFMIAKPLSQIVIKSVKRKSAPNEAEDSEKIKNRYSVG